MASPETRPTCFAIMPISTSHQYADLCGGDADHFLHVMQHLFRPAVEAAGYEFRAPRVTNALLVQAEIIKNLETADLVLCDISSLNANVFFELGIRVALDRPVALVRDDLTEQIPFDNAMMSCHTYRSSTQAHVVAEQIPLLTRFVRDAGAQSGNAMWQYFGITRRAREAEPSNPEQAQLNLLSRQVTEMREDLRRMRPEPERARTTTTFYAQRTDETQTALAMFDRDLLDLPLTPRELADLRALVAALNHLPRTYVSEVSLTEDTIVVTVTSELDRTSSEWQNMDEAVEDAQRELVGYRLRVMLDRASS